jgi:peptide subunit release factor RF-3
MTVMDEIERELGMAVVPFTWPVGMVLNCSTACTTDAKTYWVFNPGERKTGGDDEVWPDSTGTVRPRVLLRAQGERSISSPAPPRI